MPVAAASTGFLHGFGGVDERAERVTLARLLREPLLRSAKVGADQGGLEREVVWCLPLEHALTEPGRLTGILVYSQNPLVDDETMETLTRRRAAALVIEGNVPGEEARPTVCPAVLPVITVRAGLGLHKLSRLVAELTMARESRELRYGLVAHRALAEQFHRGVGIQALCRRLVELSGCSVALLDAQRKLLAFEAGQVIALPLDPSAVGRALREEPGDELLGDHADELRPKVGCLRIGDTSRTCVSHPIVLAGRHDGWVIIIESHDEPGPEHLGEHAILVEQAGMIVGTEMLRQRSVDQAEERARGDFVHALLHGRFTTIRDLEVRAAHYSYPVDASYGVVVATGMAGNASGGSFMLLSQLAREASRLGVSPGVPTMATVLGGVVAVVRGIEAGPRSASKDEVNKALADYAAALEADFSRRVGHPVLVAFGRPVTGALAVTDSYREARIALGLRRQLKLQQPCGFSDLRVYAVLADLAASSEGTSFAKDLLAPLRESDETGSGDLQRAVLAYVESGGNLNAAARALHMHRNTMLYRLDRASRALNIDLRKAEHQFAIWLAHKIDILGEVTAAVDRDLKQV